MLDCYIADMGTRYDVDVCWDEPLIVGSLYH